MSTPLAELRALNVKKQRAARSAEPEAQAPEPVAKVLESDSEPTSQSYDESYGNMTDNTESQTASKPAVRTARKKADKPEGQPVRPAGMPSMVEAIRASVQQGGTNAAPALKTVTIKLSPELDRKVEEHCFAAGRKKQDVVRDALLLYFETIEAIASEEA